MEHVLRVRVPNQNEACCQRRVDEFAVMRKATHKEPSLKPRSAYSTSLSGKFAAAHRSWSHTRRGGSFAGPPPALRRVCGPFRKATDGDSEGRELFSSVFSRRLHAHWAALEEAQAQLLRRPHLLHLLS